LLFIVMLLIVVGALFVFVGDKFDYTKDLHSALFKAKKKDITLSYVPASEYDWCRVQEIKVGETRESPVRDRITGWDLNEECCVRQVEGWNCALHRYSVLQYGYTGLVGGKIKYLLIDGYYADVTKYKEFLEDIDKEAIDNKPGDITKYPEVFQDE